MYDVLGQSVASSALVVSLIDTGMALCSYSIFLALVIWSTAVLKL